MPIKTELSPEEKIKAAYLHHVLGWPQADIAIVFDGINQGRISEACTSLIQAAGAPVRTNTQRPGIEKDEMGRGYTSWPK